MDKKNSLYQNIFNELYAKIENGELAPGDRLPTEPELAAQFGVSRVTVRNESDCPNEKIGNFRTG